MCSCPFTERCIIFFFFFFSSRRRHTRLQGDWSSDVCSSDLIFAADEVARTLRRNQDDVDVSTRFDLAVEHAEPVGDEIGRASCRGKSVDLGGRRIIKKKKTK